MAGSVEDLLVFCEVPSRDGALLLDGGFGLVVLVFPTTEEADALFDYFQGSVGFFFEDPLDVDLFLDTLADLV